MKIRDQIVGSLILIIAVVGVGGALAYAKYTQIQQAASAPPPPEMPIAVRVGTVSQVTFRQQTTVIGTVLAKRSVMLSNEVAGTVRKVGFNSGDLVEKDQVLIEFDTSVEQAELLSAQARVRLSKSTLSRMRRAATSDAVTAAEVEEAEAQFDQASASVAQLKAVIARKTLLAPFRGRVGLRNTHEGQFLSSGFQIATLQSADDFLQVDFMIPQHAADWVTVGNEVSLIDTLGTYAAKVVALDDKADKQSRNRMGRAELSPIPPQLVPGDSVRVVIDYGPELTTSAVPPEAVRRAPMNTFVYVVEMDKEGNPRAQPRTVSVGKTIGNQVAVLTGLQSGEQVVADGSFKAREGALLSIDNAEPTGDKQTAPAGTQVSQQASDQPASDKKSADKKLDDKPISSGKEVSENIPQ